MQAAKLKQVPDSIRRGINGLAGANGSNRGMIDRPVVNGTQGLTMGMQGEQNSEVKPVIVKKVDFKDLKTGEDFRYPSRDTAASSVRKIASAPGPRSPRPNDEGVGG
jgi:hypothetical protein